ncbi:hypothetical protein GCM10007940_33500 [Portibacter lacus]|uniref:DUF4185 domain-containing protein n=1 Tax=Portibacter lacus TaxID=1099794 RepID=A0AA37WGZ1_9BACT|nr:hypothetical protein GCM10007940_33500 [Portibacter lacus]
MLASCKPNIDIEKTNSTSQVESFIQQDAEWTNAFLRDENVFGVDGIFSIPLNGKEFSKPSAKDSILFVFSDSLIKLKGKIKDNKLGNDEYKMIHNSLGIATGEDLINSLKFDYKSENGMPKTVFEPNDENKEHYYWLGDGFVNTAGDSALYIFAYKIIDVETEGFFSFEQLSVDILKIDKHERYPFSNYEIIKTDLMFPVAGYMGQATFGNAILVNTNEAGAPHPDGYIYIYGTIGFEKDLFAARVLPNDFDKMSAWKYWDGKSWVSEKENVKKLVSNTSNEMSVSPLQNGQFVLVYQHAGMEPSVVMQLSKSPVGPFYPPKTIYHCPEVLEDKDFFAYNAKGHPSISSPDSLLISYNVNSFDFFVDVLTKPNLYRPRFIKISLD